MRSVTERLLRRSAASAQRERSARNLIGVPVPIDERHIVALDQIWSILSHFDIRHLSAPALNHICAWTELVTDMGLSSMQTVRRFAQGIFGAAISERRPSVDGVSGTHKRERQQDAIVATCRPGITSATAMHRISIGSPVIRLN